MRNILFSLSAFAVFAGQSWAQDAPIGVAEEAPADATGNVVKVPPALPASDATQESLEQRVQRLEAQLEQARLEQAQSGAAPADQGSAAVAPAPAVVVDNSWRYRQHNGKWWYWLPSKRWVYYSNGAWVDYVPGTPIVVAVPGYGVTGGYGYGSSYPYTTRYHSHYRPSIGVHIGGYGYGHIGHGHGHGWHGGHGHGHVGHGHGHIGHGHGHGGHGHGGHGHGGHGHH